MASLKPTSKMHVLLFANYYPPHIGGLERYCEGLALGLIELEHEVTVITHRHAANIMPYTNGRLKVLYLDPALTVSDAFCVPTISSLRSVLNQINFDLIDCISVHTRFYPLTLIGAIIGRTNKKRVIFTEHGSDYVKMPSSPTIEWIAKVYDLTLGRLALALCQVITGASVSSCEFITKLTGRPAQLLSNSVNVKFWQQQPSTRFDKFLFVGRIAAGKGWDIAIKAHRLLPPSIRSQFPLVIIGTGNQQELLETAAQDDSAIQYLGAGNSVQVRNQLTNSILLNPTSLSESLQTILIEAACSKSWILTAPTREATAFVQKGFGEVVSAFSPEAWAAAMQSSTQRLPHTLDQQLESYSWEHRTREFLSLIKP
jgi:glycosyltransferase involved in cell wall biosynthesis